MTHFPLLKGISTDTFFKSFLINAFCVAVISSTAIEMRHLLTDKNNNTYKIFNYFLPGADLNEWQVIIITFLTAFLSAFLVYHIFYLLIGYGTGMLGVPFKQIKNYKYTKM